MHCGLADIMNMLFMMQQGGMSKATTMLNLSEDIFAGMDFTLPGQSRSWLQHSVAFLIEARVGHDKQVITRRAFHLGQVLHFPEALAFYYACVGFYFT